MSLILIKTRLVQFFGYWGYSRNKCLTQNSKAMTLVKYSDFGWRPTRFSNLMDRFYDESFGTVSRTNGFRPNVDVIENEKNYEIHVAVPGVKKEDFNLDINDGVLTISGERSLEKVSDEKNYRSVETQYGSFSRSFHLPEYVISAKIDAKYVDGILVVNVPKDEKQSLKTTVKVK